MEQALDLYVEQNDGEWQVYFRQPGVGLHVLDSFNTKAEAVAYAQDQIDTADYTECDGVGQVIVVE